MHIYILYIIDEVATICIYKLPHIKAKVATKKYLLVFIKTKLSQ